MTGYEPIIAAIGSGLFYSVFWYVNKVADPTRPESWKSIDPFPLIATAIIGACIGAYTGVSGGELTQVSIGIQLASYMAFTAIIERFLKTVWNIVQTRYMAPAVVKEGDE